MKMNKLEKWFLARIFRKLVAQGPNHPENHRLIFRMLREAHRAEFNEDNEYSADECLREWFESTQSQHPFTLLKR